MKLNGSPPGLLTREQAAAKLEMSPANFDKLGLNKLLPYYRLGTAKLYQADGVYGFQIWRFVQRGLAELGLVRPSPPAPALPPGESIGAKWIFLEGWLNNDEYTIECPRCGALAVQDQPNLDERIWCANCGVVK